MFATSVSRFWVAVVVTLLACVGIVAGFALGIALDYDILISVSIVGLGLGAIPLGVSLRQRWGLPRSWFIIHMVIVGITILACVLAGIIFFS